MSHPDHVATPPPQCLYPATPHGEWLPSHVAFRPCGFGAAHGVPRDTWLWRHCGFPATPWGPYQIRGDRTCAWSRKFPSNEEAPTTELKSLSSVGLHYTHGIDRAFCTSRCLFFQRRRFWCRSVAGLGHNFIGASLRLAVLKSPW